MCNSSHVADDQHFEPRKHTRVDITDFTTLTTRAQMDMQLDSLYLPLLSHMPKTDKCHPTPPTFPFFSPTFPPHDLLLSTSSYLEAFTSLRPGNPSFTLNIDFFLHISSPPLQCTKQQRSVDWCTSISLLLDPVICDASFLGLRSPSHVAWRTSSHLTSHFVILARGPTMLIACVVDGICEYCPPSQQLGIL